MRRTYEINPQDLGRALSGTSGWWTFICSHRQGHVDRSPFHTCIMYVLLYTCIITCGTMQNIQPAVGLTYRTYRPGDVQSFTHDIVPPYCCPEMLWTQHFVLLCVSLASYWDVFSKSPAAAAAATLRFYLINCGLSVSLSDSFLWPLFDSAFLPSGLQQTVSYSRSFPNKREKGSFVRKLDILWGLNSLKLVSPERSHHLGLSVTHTGNIYACC